jgi:hypothetical protein
MTIEFEKVALPPTRASFGREGLVKYDEIIAAARTNAGTWLKFALPALKAVQVSGTIATTVKRRDPELDVRTSQTDLYVLLPKLDKPTK